MRRFAFALAHQMACTVEELGWRLSAREFAEWMVYYKNEELHPGIQRVRHAQLRAGQYNAAFKPPAGRQSWGADQFVEPDPWELFLAVAQQQALTPEAAAAQLKAQIDQINARFEE